mmetsp:Transcript_25602/g.67626  ORF Transcript_25602/g.67626 Transcript_25602/m.67626 type:complete len:175 (+) Transcript_25602:367-891(+)
MGATIENMLKMIEVKLATDFPAKRASAQRAYLWNAPGPPPDRNADGDATRRSGRGDGIEAGRAGREPRPDATQRQAREGHRRRARVLFEMGVAGSILKIAWEAELAYLVKRCMESGDEQFRLYASTGPLGLLRFYAFLKRQCYWQALKLITTSEEMALQIMTGVTLGGFAVSPR